MTTATATKTETFTVYLPVTVSYEIVVEAPIGSTKEQIIKAITSDDLDDAEPGDVWDELRYQHKNAEAADIYIEDENCDEVEA